MFLGIFPLLLLFRSRKRSIYLPKKNSQYIYRNIYLILYHNLSELTIQLDIYNCIMHCYCCYGEHFIFSWLFSCEKKRNYCIFIGIWRLAIRKNYRISEICFIKYDVTKKFPWTYEMHANNYSWKNLNQAFWWQN